MCVPFRENNDWLYILIGVLGGVIAIAAIICVLVYCMRSGVISKQKYQIINNDFVNYG